ncbi:hypothetical protein PJ985_00840 [Streptomyces sp. ACA25]|uniref:hypothetical protein n=1 Tax=Streptomyces sp. ACA25 TaxID=3022596 RepID=UPI002306EEE8|nr:hypothetical protein [Streptomyces sp. ACA25]MDB1086126.1 hypothetical protein [Streptomyces sp. ACA25]
MTTSPGQSPAVPFPPVAPDVFAAAVEGLSSRLRKRLDAAIERCATAPAGAADDDGTLSIHYGEDAVVTLAPGPSGAISTDQQARCTCLLAPHCLHRAAVLGACPVAGPDPAADAGPGTVPVPVAGPDSPADGTRSRLESATGEAADGGPAGTGTTGAPPPGAEVAPGPTPVQQKAAAGLWSAAAAVLAAGVPAAGAVLQADLLRAAHSARLAGLHRAQDAALRTVRGLRSARAREDSHRLADLVDALRELLLTAGPLAAADPDPALLGTARRGYRPGGSLRVHGVCREPVISATGYAGVVTHLLTDDGRWHSVADVRPGGPARAGGAATAPVALGESGLDHRRLARGGLLVTGATVSPNGRLGSGRGVRATPLSGLSWSSGPLAALFARPLAEAVTERLTAVPETGADEDGRAREPVGCDLVILGPAGDHVLARELRSPLAPGSAVPPGPSAEGSTGDGTAAVAADGPLIRLLPAHGHPALAHTANLGRLASRPGLRVRVVARLVPDRAAALYPLAVGPAPGAGATLRLPPEWAGYADLGYDRLQGEHLPPPGGCPPGDTAPPGNTATRTSSDPLASSPLWRVRRLVELAVAGGRRAVAGPARGSDPRADSAALHRTGFRTAAELAAHLSSLAGHRPRDSFGRLSTGDPGPYAAAWLATAVHLAGAEQALIRATWQLPQAPAGRGHPPAEPA